MAYKDRFYLGAGLMSRYYHTFDMQDYLDKKCDTLKIGFGRR